MEATTNNRRLHPLVAAAAVSVLVFSAVGVAAITGLIPHSKGSVQDQPPIAAAETSAAQPQSMPAASPEPAAPAPAPHPVKKHVAKAPVAPAPPAPVAYNDVPAYAPPPPPVAQAPQVYEAPKPAVKPGVLGTVLAVREVEDKGDAKGIGALGGGVAGAVLGHQIDHGNKLVTVLGAAGGALLGNQIEKTARATKHWELTVRYDDGSTQVFNSDAQPFWHQGDRVRLYEGKLQPV
jgi:outer membrane lipoprotein SlyB